MKTKTNVRNYTDVELISLVKKLPSFKAIPTDYWFLAVRSLENTPNIYDDKMYLFKAEKCIAVTSCTTDPGSAGLIDYKKYNTNGIAVVKADEWYYDLWAYGLHKGKMQALKQIKDILFYRDNNANSKAEEIGKIFKGIIGINWHTASYLTDEKSIKTLIVPTVGTWSLGCQVMNVLEEYYMMLCHVKKQKSVTYCLIKES